MGLVGCGILGRAIGSRLLAAGFPLTVCDLSRQSAAPLLDAGARWVASPADLAVASTVTLSCLPGPSESEAVALEPGGLFAAARPETIHVEVSTIGPATVRRLAAHAASANVRLVDAPVSRGPGQAVADGSSGRATRETVVLWVGANADTFDRVRPVLNAIADRVVYCGGIGAGQTTKIVNNFIAHGLLALVGEALALGVGAGASLDALATALQHGTGQTRLLDELLPSSVFVGDYRPGLQLDIAIKDLDLARDLARERGVDPLSTETVRELFQQARARGWGDQSAHAVVRLIEERYGVELRSLLAP